MNSDIALSGSAPNGNKSGMFQTFFATRAPVLNDKTVGELRGIYVGGMTSYDGDGSFGRNLQVGATQSLEVGSPVAPSLELLYPGFWRFRWSVATGSRAVSVNAKQTDSGQRPMLMVKANPAVGLDNDISASAAAGSGWVTIGPLSFTPTAAGMVWVHLHNTCQNQLSGSTWFDHIVTT